MTKLDQISVQNMKQTDYVLYNKSDPGDDFDTNSIKNIFDNRLDIGILKDIDSEGVAFRLNIWSSNYKNLQDLELGCNLRICRIGFTRLPLPKYLAIYASHCTDSKKIHYLKQMILYLSSIFTKVVMVISGDSDLIPYDEKISVIQVPNHSLDVGKWIVGLEAENLEIQEYRRIFLLNDSFIFTRAIQDVLFFYRDRGDIKFYGLSDSRERFYHIQSYFQAMTPDLVDVYIQWNNNLRFEMDYDTVVNHGEIGWSQHLLQHAVKIDAYYQTNNEDDFNIFFCKKKYLSLLQRGFPVLKFRAIMKIEETHIIDPHFDTLKLPKNFDINIARQKNRKISKEYSDDMKFIQCLFSPNIKRIQKIGKMYQRFMPKKGYGITTGMEKNPSQ